MNMQWICNVDYLNIYQLNCSKWRNLINEVSNKDPKMYLASKHPFSFTSVFCQLYYSNYNTVFSYSIDAEESKPIVYKEDFEDMIEEIAEMIYQLVYDYLQKTYALAKPKFTTSQTRLEWVSILFCWHVPSRHTILLLMLVQFPRSNCFCPSSLYTFT